MDTDNLILGRIKDLAAKAYENNYVTHTDFLSASELYDVRLLCASNGLITGESQINGVEYCTYGGPEDPDRNVICFLPSFMDEETFITQERKEGNIISCILIEPANRKFADTLTHRDYLGSLMSLGIERNRIGDILGNDRKAYIFVKKEISGLITDELCRIRHTTVTCREVPASECDIIPEFAEIKGTVPSERIDAILSLVYKLSRSKASDLIASGSVIVDGKLPGSPGLNLKTGNRVSVRGFGKFIYDGAEGITRKGRTTVKIRVYK